MPPSSDQSTSTSWSFAASTSGLASIIRAAAKKWTLISEVNGFLMLLGGKGCRSDEDVEDDDGAKRRVPLFGVGKCCCLESLKVRGKILRLGWAMPVVL